jgi:hypothetical protein
VPNTTADPATLEVDDDASPDEEPEAPAAPASIAASPEAVRNSPEYRALRNKLRTESRNKGRIEQQLVAEREARAAAEADRMGEQENEIRELLGDDGVEAWNRISDLSVSDPLGAAREMRRFAETLAQSQPPAAPAPAGAPPPDEGAAVSTRTPLPPVRGVGAGVPLGQSGNDNSWAAIKADAEARFGELVEMNQNPTTRNRVTMRHRAEGVITYLAGALAGHMVDRESRQR